MKKLLKLLFTLILLYDANSWVVGKEEAKNSEMKNGGFQRCLSFSVQAESFIFVGI